MTGQTATKPSRWRGDPLLMAVRVMINIGLAATLVAVVAMILSTATVPLWWSAIVRKIAEHTGSPLPDGIVPSIAALLALLAVLSSLVFAFMLLLRKIIDSVAEGNAFEHRNAGRLARMAWVTLAVQLVALPASALAGWLAHVTKAGRLEIDFSLSGLLLALILFVLARVFRQGAQMRDDLEGTV